MAERYEKGGIRNGNGIEVVLSNRLKINGILAYYSVYRHFLFKIYLMKPEGTPHQSRDSHLMAGALEQKKRPHAHPTPL